MSLIKPSRRGLLKAAAAALFVPAMPAIIRPAEAAFYAGARRALKGRGAGGGATTDPFGFSVVNFDGTNDYLTKAAGGIIGLADGKAGTFGCRFRKKADGADSEIFLLNGGFFAAYWQSDNTLRLSGLNSSATEILRDVSVATVTVSTGWITWLFSFNLATTSFGHYINGASEGTAAILTNDTIDWVAVTANAMFATQAGSGKASADVSFIYFTTTYLDLSNSANRAKFDSPAAMLSDGSGPTGSQPLIYMTGNAATWNGGTNKGSDSAWTMNSAVIDV